MKTRPTFIQATVADPKIELGRLRILRRTDGLCIIYDPTLPAGRRTVGGETFVDQDDALARAYEILRAEAETREAAE